MNNQPVESAVPLYSAYLRKPSCSLVYFSSLVVLAAALLGLSGSVRSESISIEPASSWQLRGTANALVSSGDSVFVGGNFLEVYNDEGGSLPRTYLAALDRDTGIPTSFAPNLDGEVWALALSPDEKTLYVGGSFLTAEGLPRKRIAAYDVRTGALTTLATPSPNGALRAIAVDNGRVYFGGLFTMVGSKNRPYIAAFDAATGALDQDFTASPNARVTTVVAGEDRVWIGGDFTRINDTRQRGIGSLHPVNGALQATDQVTYPVIALDVSDTQLFIAGGGPGGRAAAFNRVTGRAQWEIASDGNFQAVDADGGDYVYFGGHYESIEGNRNIDRLSRHNKRTGKTDFSWLPRLNGMRSINAIDISPVGLHIGGDFTKVYAESHEGIATLPKMTNGDQETIAPDPVNTVQGTLDNNLVAGPRWVRLRFSALTTGVHEIRVAWDSDSDVKYNVFKSDDTRISTTTVEGSNPAVWSAALDANEEYYVGLWTMDGIANYTASVTSR